MKKISYYGHKNVIHKKLAYYRELRGMTQEALATQMQLLNVSMDQQMLSRIENDLRMVTDYELACFCKILKVSERELLAGLYDSDEK